MTLDHLAELDSGEGEGEEEEEGEGELEGEDEVNFNQIFSFLFLFSSFCWKTIIIFEYIISRCMKNILSFQHLQAGNFEVHDVALFFILENFIKILRLVALLRSRVVVISSFIGVILICVKFLIILFNYVILNFSSFKMLGFLCLKP